MTTKETEYRKLRNLFLQQSLKDAWADYERSLSAGSAIRWDYVVLTASNDRQADSIRQQIDLRLAQGKLPNSTKYLVLPDPKGNRVGSGGATFGVLKAIADAERAAAGANPFKGLRILCIHSGGDSKRVPQYSAVGKLFSPVMRELPDGRPSTLFDELIIAMSGVPSRISEGMLVLSGDALLLFNPLQIDAPGSGAACLSFKAGIDIGKDHGVFLRGADGNVSRFLHKQTPETLRETGAANDQDMVDLDTGAVLMASDLCEALYRLVENDFDRFVNEKARISFYGDFLYPLATDATLEQFYLEKPEGEYTPELHECRGAIWNAISRFPFKLLSLSPARFIHFGTTRELAAFTTKELADYEFLDWKPDVLSVNSCPSQASLYASYVGHGVSIGKNSYIEQSCLLGSTEIGADTVISNVKLRGAAVPPNTAMHGIPVGTGAEARSGGAAESVSFGAAQADDDAENSSGAAEGCFVVRVYDINANPKNSFESSSPFVAGLSLKDWAAKAGVPAESLWADGTPRDLWNARLYPVCASMEEAVDWALRICGAEANDAGGGSAGAGTVDAGGRSAGPEAGEAGAKFPVDDYLKLTRLSLKESYEAADMGRILRWQEDLENRILSRKFTDQLAAGAFYKDAAAVFRGRPLSPEFYRAILRDAAEADDRLSIRITYALARYMKAHSLVIGGDSYEVPEGMSFGLIRDRIYDHVTSKLPDARTFSIAKDEVDVALPVRVNLAGGWTDTPPYCIENGGVVLNAAITLGGVRPVRVSVRRIPEYRVEFESQDIGAKGAATTLDEIRDCHNPYDSFALHKAALIASGIVPLEDRDAAPAKETASAGETAAGAEKGKKETLEDILRKLGGGIYLSTQVLGIPRGSGLGTSSILAGACIRALTEFFGLGYSDDEIYAQVLVMEQIMSTGGGWQDQVGGLTDGIKLITSAPGIDQALKVEHLVLPETIKDALSRRFALVYTGQRRLARNLLRDVMGSYIGARPESVSALSDMKSLAVLMRFALEQGNFDEFVSLLNRQWGLSKQLDAGSTNTCIEQIFASVEDLICGRFIAGAGGGGFLMVILKDGVTKDMLNERLHSIFQDSGVGVWESEFV